MRISYTLPGFGDVWVVCNRPRTPKPESFLGLTGVATGVVGIILDILGAILLITGLVGICPLYLLFKFSTKKS